MVQNKQQRVTNTNNLRLKLINQIANDDNQMANADDCEEIDRFQPNTARHQSRAYACMELFLEQNRHHEDVLRRIGLRPGHAGRNTE